MLKPLTSAIRAGSPTAGEVVAAAGARIKNSQGSLNAVVATDLAAALHRADQLDMLPQSEKARLPLFGLPLLVKDIEDAAGWRTTSGSLPFAKGSGSMTDSAVVGRLRAAGAIVLGRTNTCEFAFEGYTTNRVFGSTRNPWNPDWSPGGSSGGSAAALAAGLAPLATATDGGGSVRIPAALCGLLGLKPTHGLIGTEQTPAWLDFHTDAVLATHADDLDFLFGVLAGGDDTPGAAVLHPPVRVRRILAVPRLTGRGALKAPLAKHLRAWTNRLGGALGAPVEYTTTGKLFADAPTLPAGWDSDWYRASSAEQAHLLSADVVSRYTTDWDPLFGAAMQEGLGITLEQYLAIRRRCIATRQVLDRVLTPGTLLIAPVLAGVGYTPDGCSDGSTTPGSPDGFAQTVLANLTGHPAMSVPAGFVGPGIPFGLQLLAGRWHDRTLMQVAREWEGHSPWPTTAPGYPPFDLVGLNL